MCFLVTSELMRFALPPSPAGLGAGTPTAIHPYTDPIRFDNETCYYQTFPLEKEKKKRENKFNSHTERKSRRRRRPLSFFFNTFFSIRHIHTLWKRHGKYTNTWTHANTNQQFYTQNMKQVRARNIIPYTCYRCVAGCSSLGSWITKKK